MNAVTVTPIKALHTEKQEAARLCVSHRSLQQWRLKGGGPPFIKLGSVVRYDPETVDAWVAAHVRNNTSVA